MPLDETDEIALILQYQCLVFTSKAWCEQQIKRMVRITLHGLLVRHYNHLEIKQIKWIQNTKQYFEIVAQANARALFDETMQLRMDSVGVWTTNFNDIIPFRIIIVCRKGPQLNQKQRCWCLNRGEGRFKIKNWLGGSAFWSKRKS